MDDLTKKIYELVGIIDNRDSQPIQLRLQAISELGNVLQKEPLEAGFLCLLDVLRNDQQIRILMQAISVLSRLKYEESVPVLIDVLLATQVQVFESATDPEFLKADEVTRLRCAAAQGLGKIADKRAIIPLMSVLNNRDENYRLRLAVAESLGRLGDDYAVNPLIEILSDEREKSIYLKESVVKALGMLGDIRAVEPLIDMLESKQGFRDKFNFLKEQAIEAIRRIGQPHQKATDSLLQALQDEAPSIRLAAVEALGIVGGSECLEALKASVFDAHDDVAKAAVYAVYNLAGEEAIRDLLRQDNLPHFLKDELEGYIP